MDLRNGRTYETRDAARAAGVPDSDLALVRVDDRTGEPDVKLVTNGPFKGRKYRRNELGQMERVRETVR